MRVAVLGAGIVGLTTAYCLADDGHEVVVVDRGSGPAAGASQANGGQLSYSYVAPLADPSIIAKIPELLLSRESPLRLYPRFDPEMFGWSLRFLAACTRERAVLTTQLLLGLSFYSRDILQGIVAREAIDFDHAPTGKLVVYSDEAGLNGARAQVEVQKALGCEQEVVDTERCLAIEPALEHIRGRIAGGVFTPSDSAGDCRRLCEELEARIRRRSPASAFHYGTAVKRLIRDGDAVTGVDTDGGAIDADAVVLALGTGSRRLARGVGFDLPIHPLKGYSLTLPLVEGAVAPRVSVTDIARKIVYARIGGSLRAAGMADLAGYDEAIDAERLGLLVRQAAETFPAAGDFAAATPWAGLRPATPTGTPLLGPSPRRNLFLNVGHGALGFTLSAGAARLVADTIAGRPGAIPLDGFAL